MSEERKKVTIRTLMKKKEAGEKIVWLVVYDYPTALLADEAGVDMVLIGDSLGMNVLGYETTLPVTMEEMLHHTKAVVRAVKYAFIVGDMPFMSYQPSVEEAIKNAGAFLKAGCDAVKIEGGAEVADRVKAIVDFGIPVIGHLGLTPQKVSMLGGYRLQGKTAEDAKKIIEDAKALEEAGAFGVLIENTTAEVAKLVAEETNLIVFGIGGGPYCHGQLLLAPDVLGIGKIRPWFAKTYVNLRELILNAFRRYCEEVRKGLYPAEEHTRHMEKEEYEKLLEMLGKK